MLSPNNRRARLRDFGSAIVIGGSRGIGLAVARRLAETGISVTTAARDAATLENAVRSDTNGDLRALELDITAPDAEERLAAWIATAPMPSAAFVCPGITIPGQVAELSLEAHREMMETNYFGHLTALRALLPTMLAGNAGAIVGFSSALGLFGGPGFGGYCATKFAIVGLLESLHAEVTRRGVSVHCVCPPAVDTPGFRREMLLKDKAMLEFELSTGLLTADRVARSVLAGMDRGQFLIRPGVKWRVAESLGRHLPAIRRRLFQQSSVS